MKDKPFYKKKFLKKPSSRLSVGLSSEKTLKSFANNTGPLVKEAPPKELVKDERSLYFKKEMENERKGVNKWLS